MKSMIMTVAFAMASVGVFAQTTPDAQSPAQTKEAVKPARTDKAMKESKAQDHSACTMPEYREVMTLQLTPDQEAKVRDIYASCEKECATAMKENGSVNKESIAKHEERMKEVLTSEQYERYTAMSDMNKKRHEKKNEMKRAQ